MNRDQTSGDHTSEESFALAIGKSNAAIADGDGNIPHNSRERVHFQGILWIEQRYYPDWV
jgi:hypothetical protein